MDCGENEDELETAVYTRLGNEKVATRASALLATCSCEHCMALPFS